MEKEKGYENLVYVGPLKDKQQNINSVYLDKDAQCYLIKQDKPKYRNTLNWELRKIHKKYGRLEKKIMKGAKK